MIIVNIFGTRNFSSASSKAANLVVEISKIREHADKTDLMTISQKVKKPPLRNEDSAINKTKGATARHLFRIKIKGTLEIKIINKRKIP